MKTPARNITTVIFNDPSMRRNCQACVAKSWADFASDRVPLDAIEEDGREPAAMI
jgi:hypothetical protein